MNNRTEQDTKEYYLPFQSFDGTQKEPPLSSRVRIEFGAVSDIGKVRQNNEDAFVIYRTGRFWQNVRTNLPDGIIPEDYEENAYTMAVADGMGGLSAGEVASRTALATIVNLVLSSVKWALKLNEPGKRQEEIVEAIKRGIDYLMQADASISRRAEEDAVHKGMGTTVTGMYIYADDLFIFHVGDSRGYLFRNGQLNQITHDHTVAQELADSGVIPQSAVEGHQFKHVLTRAVGLHQGKVNVEIHHLKLLPDDSILLCTDGLSDLVKTEEIATVLSAGPNSQEKCEDLLRLALANGGKDNITVVLGHYTVS